MAPKPYTEAHAPTYAYLDRDLGPVSRGPQERRP
jgi:hypothetical protein